MSGGDDTLCPRNTSTSQLSLATEHWRWLLSGDWNESQRSVDSPRQRRTAGDVFLQISGLDGQRLGTLLTFLDRLLGNLKVSAWMWALTCSLHRPCALELTQGLSLLRLKGQQGRLCPRSGPKIRSQMVYKIISCMHRGHIREQCQSILGMRFCTPNLIIYDSSGTQPT